MCGEYKKHVARAHTHTHTQTHIGLCYFNFHSIRSDIYGNRSNFLNNKNFSNWFSALFTLRCKYSISVIRCATAFTFNFWRKRLINPFIENRKFYSLEAAYRSACLEIYFETEKLQSSHIVNMYRERD